MDNLGEIFDSLGDGVKKAADNAHKATETFHKNYISKVTPDLGKYGDSAKFVAELAPGVSEYNALKDGDWTGFAISAGLDVGAVALGALTAGAGYAAIKGGTSVAKAGTKAAIKEVAEAGTKKVVKETAETATKKGVEELAEKGAKEAVSTTTQEVSEKFAKESIENAAKEGTEKVAKETRILHQEEKNILSNGGMSEANINKCHVGADGRINLTTVNEVMENKISEDGVRYVKKAIEINGSEITGVFPEFPSVLDIHLPVDKQIATAKIHKNISNHQLKEAVGSSQQLADRFTAEQLEQINNYDTPDGFTWHHNEEPGKMQLVNADIHQANVHTGGKSIWGGGYGFDRNGGQSNG